MSKNNLVEFRVSINYLWPGEKIVQRDQRLPRYHGGFRPETHTPEGLLQLIEKGCAFCPELLTGNCGREHHGERWCCKERREKGDPTHCGRPDGYRISHHFKSAQHLALDIDTGNLNIEDLLADTFIAQHATFIYSTISFTLDNPKWRVVFILTEAITNASTYRKAATALLARYQNTDQQVKDPARLFFGMKPGNGESHYLGHLLPMSEALNLVGEYDDRRREMGRESDRQQIPQVNPSRITGNTPDEKYVTRAIEEESAWLSAQAKGTGARHSGLLVVAARLESLRLGDWLSPEARGQIDPYAIVMQAARANGYIDEYGEADTRRAIAWGIGVAEARPRPDDWTQSTTHINGASPDGWEMPIPFDPVDTPPFPIEALPTGVSEYVSQEATSRQTPVGLAGSLMLGSVSTSAAGKAKVYLNDDWTEPLNLYITVGLPSGERKSAEVRSIFRPVEDYEQELAGKMAQEIRKLQTEREILEAKLRDAKSEAAKKPGKNADPVRAEAREYAEELAAFRIPPAPGYWQMTPHQKR